MSKLRWVPAGGGGGDPESHNVHWAITRPDAPGRKPRGVLRIGHALAPETLGDGDPQKDPGRVTRALRDQLKLWGLELPCDLLPADTLRPDLRTYGAAKPSPSPGECKLGTPLPEGSVFVGVIDDAIALANERFRDEHGKTRVDYFWNQGGRHDGGDVPFGSEFFRSGIDGIFDDSGGASAGGLDEESVYRRMGLVNMARRELQREAMRLSHGTAVLDIAAGEKPSAARRLSHGTAVPDIAAGERPSAAFQLALVSMPQQVTQDTSGTFAAPFAISGILRILEHVDRRRIEAGGDRKYPVIINLSFGLTAGSKDGQGVVEQFLDLAAKAWGSKYGELRFVVSAGNHRLARIHAVLPLPRETHPLFWRLLPDDRTASFVEIWGKQRSKPDGDQRSKPDGDQASFSIAIQPPGFDVPAELTNPEFGCFYDLRAADGRLMMRAWFDWHERPNKEGRWDKEGRESVTLAVPPTAPDEDGTQPVPPGDWQILVEPTGDDKAWPINLFIHRDDSLPGYVSKGRQSRFHDNRYRVRDDSGRLQLSDEPRGYVRRSGTLNAYGYSAAAVVVGGCHWDGLSRGKPARGTTVDYSGEGFPPDHDAKARRPDVMAPSEESRVRHGVIAAGTRSGSKIRLGGTSVAAPAVARAMAVQLARQKENFRVPSKRSKESEEEFAGRVKVLGIALEKVEKATGDAELPKALLPPLPRRDG